MGEIRRIGDLEIDQDLDFQRASWNVERVGWMIMGLILLAGLAGFLGPGPMSRSVAGVKDSDFWVEYNRFVRYKAPTTLLVRLKPRSADAITVQIRVNRSYMENTQMEYITPNPAAVELAGDSLVYTFHVEKGEGVSTIVFPVKIESIGTLDVRMGIVGGPEVSFSQFAYP